MKNILYSNICNSSLEELKQDYSEAYDIPEEEKNNIPESELYRFWNVCNEDEYDNFKYYASKNMKNKKYIILGKLGLWHGIVEVAAIETGYNAIVKCFSDCDHVTVEDKEGKLLVTAHHHDGTNNFELRELAFEGEEKLEENNCPDMEFLNTLFFSNKFTKIPNINEGVML